MASVMLEDKLNLDSEVSILKISSETKNYLVSTLRIILTGFKSWSWLVSTDKTPKLRKGPVICWRINWISTQINLDSEVSILKISSETKNYLVSTLRIILTGFKSWSRQIEKSQSLLVSTDQTSKLREGPVLYKRINWTITVLSP